MYQAGNYALIADHQHRSSNLDHILASVSLC